MFLSSKSNIPLIENLLFISPKQVAPLGGDTNFFSLNEINEISKEGNTKIIEKQSPIIPSPEPKTSNESPELPIVTNEIKNPEPIIEKKYKIETDEGCKIKLPLNYSTDDEDEKRIVDLINGKEYVNWEEALNSEGVIVYKNIQEDTGTIMLKTFGSLPYSLETILKAFNTIEIRRKWDKSFNKIEILSKNEEENKSTEVLYLYMPFPFMMTDRDWIQQKTFWNNYAGPKTALFHMKSVDHPNYPPKEKPIRAIMFIGGYYMEEVSEKETKIITLNHTDVKLSKMMMGMANKMAPEGSKKFLECLRKGCEIEINN